ncbi:MAG TPA: ABC transporter ATP-binding protein [Patescibacteria group bacterium]|jgi:putative ABC transport system ATP-binding protein|nr:ABC transporter ATP-binding protein [Patescibacteria group bacterium]
MHLPLIELRSVSKHYKVGRETSHVLKNVNLSVNKGEFIAIVGPSGSGKTTLGQIIGGLTQPDSGTVLVGGRPLDKRSDKRLSEYRNQQVGFVLQQFSLLPGYSAIENVMLPLMLAKVNPKRRQILALEQLRAVGLADKSRQSANKLSGGERQRVAIARALVMSPSILIADEPTGSLDAAHSQEISSLLHQLNKLRGVTVLLITHNLELTRHAGRLLTIDNGQVINKGSYALA